MSNLDKSLILIVDDNKTNIQVLAQIVEDEGYDIAVSLNGPDALEFVKDEKPDLILLDVMMPEMNGYEVSRALKADKATKDIPIIFLTAKREVEDIVEGFEAGGVDYITKPFEKTELLCRIKTHVELKKAREEIKTLQGIIPICANCKKIRNDEGFWNSVEEYFTSKTEALFSHGVCPTCMENLYGHLLKKKKEVK